MADNTRMLQILDRLVVFMAGAGKESYSQAGMDKIDAYLKTKINQYIEYDHGDLNLSGHSLVFNNRGTSCSFQVKLFQDGENQSSYDIIANSTYKIDNQPVYDTDESRKLMYENAVRFRVFS